MKSRRAQTCRCAFNIYSHTFGHLDKHAHVCQLNHFAYHWVHSLIIWALCANKNNRCSTSWVYKQTMVSMNETLWIVFVHLGVGTWKLWRIPISQIKFNCTIWLMYIWFRKKHEIYTTKGSSPYNLLFKYNTSHSHEPYANNSFKSLPKFNLTPMKSHTYSRALKSFRSMNYKRNKLHRVHSH